MRKLKVFVFGALALASGILSAAASDARPQMHFAVFMKTPKLYYRCGEMAEFVVRATVPSAPKMAQSGAIKATFDDCGPNKFGTLDLDLSQTNEWVLAKTLDAPGFLRLGLTAPATCKGSAYNSVGFEPEKLVKGSPRPADFDSYWANAKAECAKIPLDMQRNLLPDRSKGKFNFWRINCAAPGGKRVHGYLSIPKDASATKRYPVRIGVSAAGIGPWTNNMSGSDNGICAFFTVHAFESPFDVEELRNEHKKMSAELQTKYGMDDYAKAGITASREEYYFYRPILGIDRAITWIVSLPEADKTNVTYEGTSQGGGFGFILLGLNHSFTRGVLYVPAITDTMGYRKGRMSGWPRLVESYPKEKRAQIEKWAPYFDAANFASLITCPVRIVYGLSDPTCPPCCIYASYNEIRAKDKAIVPFFGMTHSVWPNVYRMFGDWCRGKDLPPIEHDTIPTDVLIP